MEPITSLCENISTARFLIVDDNMVNRSLLNYLLEPYGECVWAADGLEAIDRYKTASIDDQPFSVVFMDVMMPDFNGFDALEEIRLYEGQKELKPSDVVMVSALKGQEQIDRSVALGAKDYLLKPVRQDDIFGLLENLGISRLK